MSGHPRGVDQAIARFDEVMGRIDRSAASRAAQFRVQSRGLAAAGRKLGYIGIALAILFAVTVGLGLAADGIGLGGLFIVASLMVLIVLGIGFFPTERPIVDFKEDMPNKAVVQRLDSLLVRKRQALPAPAASRIDAISAQLPLLENRLSETEIL